MASLPLAAERPAPGAYAALREVLLCRPDATAMRAASADPAAAGYRGAVDAPRALDEWDAFAALLDGAGVRVHDLAAEQPDDGSLPNRQYVRDQLLVTAGRCLLASPRSAARRAELAHVELAMERRGLPVERIEERLELGDVVRADDALCVAGVGGRSTAAGAAALRRRLGAHAAERWLAVDLAPLGGGVAVAHLDLCFNVVGDTALVAHAALGLPAVLAGGGMRRQGGFGELLRAVGLQVAPVPDALQRQAGTNVLVLGADRVVAYEQAADGLRRLLEPRGVEVLSFPGAALLQSGGGPRCLSASLVRER